MNTKKVVAAIVGTALVATTAMSFAGCKEKTAKLNISDYAIEYTEAHKEAKANKGYTQLKELTTYKNGSNIGSGYIVKTDVSATSGDTIYNVYNANYGKEIGGQWSAYPVDSSNLVNLVNGVTGIKMVASEYTYTPEYATDPIPYHTYTIYAPDGTSLIGNIVDYEGCSTLKAYVNGADETSTVIVLTGNTTRPNATNVDRKANEVKKYYEVKQDEETKLYSFTSLNVNNIKPYSPEYNSGSYLTVEKEKIYESTKEKPVEGDLANYEYLEFGNTLTIYKDDNEVGTVDLTNRTNLGFVGNYCYYCEAVPVDSMNKSGYNLVFTGDVQVKYNYTLYKYDFVKNKTSEVKDTYVYALMPQYNYNTKSYDAAIVGGYKAIDGVYYAGYSDYTYITDAGLTKAYDITDLADGLSIEKLEICKLNDTSYLAGPYVVDENLKVVCEVDEGVLEEGLIPFTVNGYYGYKDFSGRVVIEPNYYGVDGGSGNHVAPVFYGGVALVAERQSDLSEKSVLLSIDGNSREVKTDEETQWWAQTNGAYILRKLTRKADYTGTNYVTALYTYTVYNYNGTVLKTFANSDNVTYNVPSYISGYFVVGETTVTTEGVNVKNTVYQLA